ncbi:MAG: HEAT repeat domain-containing protein [Myxococcales bacterium]|nr:HEAT repeat domain-containing protein [Myxococcales bacterium]
MAETKKQPTEVKALPIQLIHMVYSLMFGLVLWELRIDMLLVLGVTIFLCSLGFNFGKVRQNDVPLVIAVMYAVGVGTAYALLMLRLQSSIIILVMLTLLFVGGVAGNILYFLSEKQKLSYLNGQIAEDRLTLRGVDKWFPLWLIIGGNVLLIFAVTPAFWAALHSVTGKTLFAVKGHVTLFDWFGYVLSNVNQSFLGLASLVGIKFNADIVITPTRVGKAFLMIFRVGTISLAVGAVKRYLDLRETTKRLMMALGRSGMELDQKEAEAEAREDYDRSLLKALDSQRRMWQTRFQILLRLFPGQLESLLQALQDKGLWQLRLQNRLKRKKGEHNWDVADWIRAEIAALLMEPRLLQEIPGSRDRILRILLNVLEKGQAQGILPSELRRKGAVSLVQMLREYDPPALRERVQDCVEALLSGAKSSIDAFRAEEAKGASVAAVASTDAEASEDAEDEEESEEVEETEEAESEEESEKSEEESGEASETAVAAEESADATPAAPAKKPNWTRISEERAHLAAIYSLIVLGELDRLALLLPVLQIQHSSLPFDVRGYFMTLEKELPGQGGALLRATQRLMEAQEEEEFGPVLDELALVLQRLKDTKEDESFRELAAEAIGIGMLDLFGAANTQRHAARVMALCGATHALPRAWKLWRSEDRHEMHQQLLDAFVRAEMTDAVIDSLRDYLASSDIDEQERAAELLGLLPAGEANREALREKASQDDAAEAVRWMSLRSLAELASAEDLGFLQGLQITKAQNARLWSILWYARYRCGDAQSLVDLVDVLASKDYSKKLGKAVQETLRHARPVEGNAACNAMNPKKGNESRREACEDLVSYRSPLALLVLGHILRNEGAHKSLRQGAAEDLGLLGRALHKDDLEALASVHTPAGWVSPALVYALENDSDRLVRIRSARALGRLGLSDINERFERLLRDPKENALLRQVVAEAIGEMGDIQWKPLLLTCYADEKSLQVKQGMLQALNQLGADTEFFFACLQKESNPKIQAIALEALSQRQLSDKQKLALLPFLDGSHKDTRSAAADCLGALRVEAAIQPLLTKVDVEQESNKDVRRAALKALRRLVRNDEQRALARPALERCFRDDPDHLVLQDCAGTISRLIGRDATPLFLEALGKIGQHEPYKKGFAGIVRALGDLRAPEAGPMLFKLLRKELNAPFLHLPRLISLIRPAGLAGGSTALPQMFDLITRNDPAFSWIATQVVAEIGDPEALDWLAEFLEEQREAGTLEPNLEAGLLIAMVRLGSFDRLLELVQLLVDPERPVARRRALGMLDQLEMGLSELALMLAMNPEHTPHEKLRETAVGAMGRLLGKVNSGVQALRWQANADPRAKIREAANDAVRNVVRQLNRTIQQTQQSEVSSLPSAVLFRGQPLHPTFAVGAAANDNVVLDEIPVVLAPLHATPQTPASTATTAATGVPVTQVPEPEPEPEIVIEYHPSYEQKLMEAIEKNDLAALEQLLKVPEQNSTFSRGAHWDTFLSLLAEKREFLERFGKGWRLVPGYLDGPIQARPFLMMERAVTRGQFIDHCRAQGLPFPAGFRSNAKEFEDPQGAITRVTWWDAQRFAEQQGLQLPNLQQLLSSREQALTDLFGDAAQRVAQPRFSEWTASFHGLRNNLVQTFVLQQTAKQHRKRDEIDADLTFRCVYVLSPNRSLFERALAEQKHTLKALFAFSAQHTHQDALSEKVVHSEEWALLQSYKNNAPYTFKPSHKVEIVRMRPGKATKPIIVSSPAPTPVAPPKPAEPPPPPPPTPTERFWKLVQKNDWNGALKLLQKERAEIDPKLAAAETELRAAVEWIQANADKVLFAGEWAGDHRKRPYMLDCQPISRGRFLYYCQQQKRPLPRGWKPNAKNITEPEAPVTGVSLFEAELFASDQGASIPSFDQLLAAQFLHDYSALDAMTASVSGLVELTSTRNELNRRLVKNYTMDGYGRPRTQRLDEPANDVSFRLCRVLERQQIPALMLFMLDQNFTSAQPQSYLERLQTALRDWLKQSKRAAS